MLYIGTCIALWWVIPVIFISIRYQVVWESVSMESSTISILDIARGHNTHANIDVIQIQLKMWKCCENVSVKI